MPRTFKAIDAHCGNTDSLCLQSMANSDTFVNNFNAMGVEGLHERLWAAASGFNNLHAALTDYVDVIIVVDFGGDHAHSQVNRKRFVCERLTFFNFLPEQFRCWQGQCSHYTQGARIRCGCCQFGSTYAHHAPTNDRCFNAK